MPDIESPLTPNPKSPSSKAMPFSWAYPLIAGAVAGILLRFVFSGAPGDKWSAMAGAFIYFVPALVGAVTVYVAERRQRKSWGYYFWAPFIANCWFVLGTMLIMIEGLICAVVIIPLFACLGGLGGLAMGFVCRVTNWPKQALYSFGLLPIALGALGDHLSTPTVWNSVQRSIVVNATPEQVWAQLNHATDIRPEEFGATWAARIGVPMPLSGVTKSTPSGLVRVSRWDKQVQFDEPISDWEPVSYLRWTYRFYPTSFPAHALDDHVMIGGHYFDLHDTSFRLTPIQEGTRLVVTAKYRVSTQFNFYADGVAQLLLGNLLETGLEFYKNRSEAVVAMQ